MKIELEKHNELDRGERYIVVDGVRWGRTHVTHHGVYGTSFTFRQVGGGIICDRPDAKYSPEARVRSMRTRRGRREDGWKPTDQLVMEKVHELIEKGLLKHPDEAAAENERFNREWAERVARQEKQKQEAFEAKARETLLALGRSGSGGEVSVIVEAMRWAQEQA